MKSSRGECLIPMVTCMVAPSSRGLGPALASLNAAVPNPRGSSGAREADRGVSPVFSPHADTPEPRECARAGTVVGTLMTIR